MITVKEFHRPKLGNSEEEYEDAFAYNIDRNRFAIADGASDSIFSGIWARSLAEAFVNIDLKFSSDLQFLKRVIFESRKRWYNSVPWDTLRVFVKNKAIKGSFSTFLGIETERKGNNFDFRGIAIGDSCMFIPGRDGMTGFPLNDPAKFNITPKLIWSGYGSPFPEEYNTKIPDIMYYEGSLPAGSSIVMATDALSMWALSHAPKSFQTLMTEKDPIGLITGLMEKREIRNDDITFSMITLDF